MRPKQEKETVKTTLMFTPEAKNNLELLSRANSQDMSGFLSSLLTNQKYQLLASFLDESGMTTEPVSALLEGYINRSCGALAADKGEKILAMMIRVMKDMEFISKRLARYQSYYESKFHELCLGMTEEIQDFTVIQDRIQAGTFACKEELLEFSEICLDNMWRPNVWQKDAPFRILKVSVDAAFWAEGKNCALWYPQFKELVTYLY